MSKHHQKTPREPLGFKPVLRAIVRIDCPTCSYPRGIKCEDGVVMCGMCGGIQ